MLWIKTFHIFFVIGWMTSVFAVPRILLQWKFAVNENRDALAARTLSIKFFRFGCIMAVLALGFGVWLWLQFGFSGRWLHWKLAMVALLLVHYAWSGRLLLRAMRDAQFPAPLFLRVFNESPVFLLVPIIYLVLAKP